MKFDGSTYNFSFHDNILVFSHTRYDCKVWKGANMEYHQSFRAYTGGIVIRCGALFTWDARDDAIYFSKKDEPEKLKYQWIKQ